MNQTTWDCIVRRQNFRLLSKAGIEAHRVIVIHLMMLLLAPFDVEEKEKNDVMEHDCAMQLSNVHET